VNFFQVDTEENRRVLLERARQIALIALQKYDLKWKHIYFNQLSDTITFKIVSEADGYFLLRIHSGMMSRDEVRSEIMFLDALSKYDDLIVPEGVASLDGTYVLEIDLDDGIGGSCVTLMRWIEGENGSGNLTDNRVFNIGIMMAKLHQTGKSFVPPPDFTRPVWGEDSFRRDMIKLKQYYGVFLSDEAWKLYQAAANKITSELAMMNPNDDNYGLIHADLHKDNLIFNADTPSPIDFGRCGYGYHLYDIAGLILGLKTQKRSLFIQGYESVRRLEHNYVQRLECFFVMVMIENYCTHCSDHTETAGLIAEQPYAQASIREYLCGAPFLFNPIKLVET
jgi:Ser/Thr protein kinase RdoA (MazF antagonist)